MTAVSEPKKRKAATQKKEEKVNNEEVKDPEVNVVEKVEVEVEVPEPEPEAVVSPTKKKDDSPKAFVASQGRLRKLFLKSGLTGRISRDVFDILDKKIKCLTEQRIKMLVVKDKRILYDDTSEEKEKVCELPITPFRDYIKNIIKKEYDISRVSPDIIESLHYQIEKDTVKLCQYAQEIMKNSTRKTLFANDIDVASKALLREP
jgi:histone H3/H4